MAMQQLKRLVLLTIGLSVSSNVMSQYMGSGSVSQGVGQINQSNLYTCSGGRITNIGSITAQDSLLWTVPAEVNFTNNQFPFASSLHNVCIGANYANADAAIAALTGNDIVTIDENGEVISAYIFADNYFEMYINGIPVGKDDVPYTQFNSNIVRFKVNRPFTIAMLLVDWEENLGIGTEVNGGFTNHAGDGGMVAIFKDASNTTIAITDNSWKAQTFYTAPIIDLTCPSEIGNQRLSTNCLIQDSNDGTSYYGLHWMRPSNWQFPDFDDSSWPSASLYSNAEIGVNNKPAYTNFTSLFDDPTNDAQFIWSTNVVLDNEVIVRHTVNGPTSTGTIDAKLYNIYPNPTSDYIMINGNENSINHSSYLLFNIAGEQILQANFKDKIDVSELSKGIYYLKIISPGKTSTHKVIVH